MDNAELLRTQRKAKEEREEAQRRKARESQENLLQDMKIKEEKRKKEKRLQVGVQKGQWGLRRWGPWGSVASPSVYVRQH